MKTLTAENTKILISCHTSCELPASNFFLPVHAGRSLSSEKLNIQPDDECNGKACDNISTKNKSYCELTAIYWAWKNIKTIYPELEFIGLNHYRRFFIFENINKRITSIEYKKLSDITYPVYPAKLQLPEKSIITPRGSILNNTLQEQYCLCHYSEDYRLLKETVQNLYPEYYNSFIQIFEKNYVLMPYNMFIMPFSIFEEYCSWLFKILDTVETKSNYKTYNPKQQRIFGYMAERLLSVYVYHNNLKTLQFPVAFINPDTAFTIHKTSVKRIIKNAIRKKWNL
jgi:hypothetical protein